MGRNIKQDKAKGKKVKVKKDSIIKKREKRLPKKVIEERERREEEKAKERVERKKNDIKSILLKNQMKGFKNVQINKSEVEKKKKFVATLDPEKQKKDMWTPKAFDYEFKPEDTYVEKTEEEAKKEMSANMSDFQMAIQDHLRGGRFRYLNESLYTKDSTESVKEFQDDPSLFDQYHIGYQEQVKSWPIHPLQNIIKELKRPTQARMTIADMGCGDAELHQKLQNKHTVHSFDLVSNNRFVTACDIAHVPLGDETVDYVVFCLSLMGTNYPDFIAEANRILVRGGKLKIAEIESRIPSNNGFVRLIEKFGFELVTKDTRNQYFFTFEFKKKSNCKDKPIAVTNATEVLKPCLYKRR